MGELFQEGQSLVQLEAPPLAGTYGGLCRGARALSLEGIQPFMAVLGACRADDPGLSSYCQGAPEGVG